MQEGARLENYIDHVCEKRAKLFEVTNIVGAYRFLKPPSQRPITNNYNFSQIYLIHSGNGVITTERGTYAFSPGDMFYMPAYKENSYQCLSGDCHYELINFVCESEAMSLFEGAPRQLMEAELLALQEVLDTVIKISAYNEVKQPLVGVSIKENIPEVVLSYVTASLEGFWHWSTAVLPVPELPF